MKTVLIYCLSLIAILVTVYCWYQAQLAKKNHANKKRLLFLLSSLVSTVSAFGLLWQSQGREFGTFFVIFHISWLAWLLILTQGQVKYTNRIQKNKKVPPAEYGNGFKAVVIFFAGPVALFLSICCSLLIARYSLEGLADQWVVALLLVPVIWGAMVCWFVADKKIIRPIAVTFLVILISVFLLS